MKRTYFTILFLIVASTTITAQYFPIDTARLNNAYRILLLNPESKNLQLDFFKAFPENWNDFNNTYRYCDKKGYDLSMYNIAHKHIQALSSCTAINDTIFCNKLIALSVGATLDADAPNYLQEILHKTMKRYNDTFLHCLSKINKGHQMQFWQFYWSNIIDGRSQLDEFNELYNKNKEKYLIMMKAMSTAFEYFNKGVLYMEDFNKFMKDTQQE